MYRYNPSLGITSLYMRFIEQTVYTVFKIINYKIFPVASLNKYLHYGISVME